MLMTLFKGCKPQQIVRKKQTVDPAASNCDTLIEPAVTVYPRGLQTFLSEGHISYHTTVPGPDILRHAIVSGYVTFCQINNLFGNC